MAATSQRTTGRTKRSPRPPAAALRGSEEKFAGVFRLSPDAMVISSLADGHVVDANESFFRVTGYTTEEVMGRRIEELDVWQRRDDWAGLLARLQAEGSVREMELEFHSQSGSSGAGLISAALIEVAGEPCLITIARDITAQKQAEAKLREYTAELQARSAELETFAHMVAHDLKSPLSNIAGFAELLQINPDLSAHQRQDYITAMARNAARLHNIIDELLLLAQMRRDEVELLPIDTASIIGEMQLRLAFMIAEAQAVIQLPGAWPPALGYPPWVEEVWVNYVSNAIKHGGHSPQIELGSEQLPDGHLRFWVRDNGRGVPREVQANLFSAFGKKSTVRATGYGLGLSIVKQIVEKMGGQVGAESDGVPGQGSTFWFTLPALD